MRCRVCFRRTSAERDCPEHPSAAAAEPAPAPVAPALPGLQLGELAGRGGFADVFRAVDGDGRALVVKLLRDPDDRRFERERALLEELGPPHVPLLYGAGQTADGRQYLTMEDLGADSLAARMLGPPLVEPAAVEGELGAVADALDAIHRAGILHRDLKPENLFFRAGGAAAIIDLGLARRVDEPTAETLAVTRTGQRMGTAEYMAPEQWDDARGVTPAADLYALGVVAFERCTGRPPFVGDFATLKLAHATHRCPEASSLAPLGPAVDAVFARALAKDPAQRFDSARALIDALLAALAAPRRAAVPAPPGPADSPATAERPREIAFVALFVADRPLTELRGLVDSVDGVVARSDSGRFTVGLPRLAAAAGARAAVRLARRALSAGIARRAVVHVAPAVVRQGRRGTVLRGEAVRAVDRWARAGAGELVQTDRVDQLLGATAAGADPHGVELAPIEPELVSTRGRAELLSTLQAELTRGRGPRLVTVVGEVGVGKSRVLAELARGLRASGIPSRYLRAGSEQLGASLLRGGLDLPAERLDADGLAAAWAQLDAPPAARTAAALLLGIEGDDAPAVKPLLQAPGALRQLTARAIGAALNEAARQRGGVVLIDDVHAADQAVLDAIELATMAGGCPDLAICVAAAPSLDSLRPAWSDRAAAAARHLVGPLSPADSRAILTELLHPVEFVPAAVIDRLCELADGVPALLVDLARAVRGAGVIRRKSATAGYVVAADELLEAASQPLADRLRHNLARQVPSILLPLAQLCALLEDGIDGPLVDQVRRRLPPDDPLAELDAVAGLQRLCRREVLRGSGGSFAVSSPLLVAALGKTLDADRKRLLHAAVLAHLQSQPVPDREQVARHAQGAGDREVAGRQLHALGERERQRHRYVAAERYYTAALDCVDPDSDLAALIVAGRGRVRYRLQRFDEAIADLGRARALAEARGDRAQVAELYFEEATALDWRQDWKASTELAEKGLPIAEQLGEPLLLVKARLAIGRSLHRQERNREAAELLDGVVAAADQLDAYEERVIARLLLGSALLYSDRLDEAEDCLGEVIELCRGVGDDLHLAAAHTNRQMLWVRRHDVDRSADELAICIRLSRELGNGQLERVVSFNLAELELWRGNYDVAERLATRANDLKLGFDHTRPEYALLLARISCARGGKNAAEQLAWIDASCSMDGLPPCTEFLLEAVRLHTAEPRSEASMATWDGLAAAAQTAGFVEEQVEILLLATDRAVRDGRAGDASRWLARARAVAGDSPLWTARLTSCAADLAAL